MVKVTIDGKEYDTEKLSDETKNALGALQFAEVEIQRLQAQLGAMQTARMVYANALKQALERSESAAPNVALSGDTIQFN